MAGREQMLEALLYWQEQGDLDKANELRTLLKMPSISEDGLPMGVRASVGASRGPDAQRQSLENFYPGQVQNFGDDNFLVGDQLYNPPGLDMGDVVEHGRVGAEMLGAGIGGTLGLPAGLPGLLGGAGLGGEMAGTLYDKGMQLFGGAEDTRGSGQRVEDTAMGVGFNSMGGPLPGRTGQAAATMAERTMMHDAAQEVGLPPLTPAQRDNNLSARVEGALEGTLFGGPAINKQRGNISDAVNDYIDEMWPAPVSRNEAGSSLISGVERKVGVKGPDGLYPEGSLRANIKKLYDEVDNILGAAGTSTDGRISMQQGRKLMEEVVAAAQRDPEYSRLINTDPDLALFVDTLKQAMTGGSSRVGASGGSTVPSKLPTYETIKRFRTTVGEKLESPFITTTGGNQAEKRRLYGVLSDDLAAGAAELGGETVKQAASRASWYNKGVMQRLEKLDPIFKNADNPTRVYEILAGKVISDPGTVAVAKRSMPKDAWEEFINTYTRELLAATPGAENAAGNAVSFGRIATEINKLKRKSPEGFALIADGKEKALDSLQVVANKLRENSRFVNYSRTGSVNALGTAMAPAGAGGISYMMNSDPAMAAGIAGVGILSATAIPYLMAKTLTSPTIQSAVEKLARSDISTIRTTQDFMRALVAAGADEREVQEIFAAEAGELN